MRAARIALIAAATALATTAAYAAEGSGGLPQLNPNDFAPQLFWLAVTFTLLYVLMSRVALPRIGEVIEERDERIQRDLSTADRLKSETEQALQAYEKALADARSNASEIARETRDKLAKSVDAERADVESKLARQLADAESRIEETKTKALSSVNDIAGGVVGSIVTELSGQAVTDADVSDALKR